MARRTSQEVAQEAIEFARFKQQQLAQEKARRAQELGNNLDAPRVANRPRTPRTQTGQAVSGLAGAVSDAVKNKARALNPVPRVVNTARGVDRSIANRINSLTSPDQIPQGPRKLTKVSTPKGKLPMTQAEVDAKNRALKKSRFDKLNITPRGGTSLRIDSPRIKKVKNALAQERAMGTGTGGRGYTAQDFIRDAKGNKLIPPSVAKPGFDDLAVRTPLDIDIEGPEGEMDARYQSYDDFPGGAEPPANQIPDDSIRQRALSAGTIDASKLPDQSLFTGVSKAEVEKVPMMRALRNKFARGQNRDPKKAVTLDNPLPEGADVGGKTDTYQPKLLSQEVEAMKGNPYAKNALSTLRKSGKLLTPFADPIGFMADMRTLAEASDAERGVIGYEPRPAEFIPTNRMVPDAPRNAPRREGTFRMQPEMAPNPERRSDFDYFRFGPKPIYSPEAEMYRQGA